MFLLRTLSKHYDTVYIFETEDEALDRARAFVGRHVVVDSCSTHPRTTTSGPVTRIQRSGSFGTRFASVHPVEVGIPITLA